MIYEYNGSLYYTQLIYGENTKLSGKLATLYHFTLTSLNRHLFNVTSPNTLIGELPVGQCAVMNYYGQGRYLIKVLRETDLEGVQYSVYQIVGMTLDGHAVYHGCQRIAPYFKVQPVSDSHADRILRLKVKLFQIEQQIIKEIEGKRDVHFRTL